MLIAGTDGSELSIEALRTGLALLSPDEDVLLVTVVDFSDPTLVSGTGMAGGVMTEGEFEELDQASLTGRRRAAAVGRRRARARRRPDPRAARRRGPCPV